MEGCLSASSTTGCLASSQQDWLQSWRSPSQESFCRALSPTAPLDFNMGSFSLSPALDFEPLFFNRCPTSYKDFPVYKEKNPHDMADVLLSLKEAVVHPGQTLPSLSPLSPVNSFAPYGQAYPQPPTNPYTVHHPQPYAQYSQCLEGPPPPPPPQMTTQPPNMFPSMSVNVSMNMTMGMPGMGYNMEQCPATHQQMTWNTGQTPSHPTANMGTYATGQNPMVSPIQMSYCNAAAPNYSASGSYSFTAEFRPTTHEPACSNPSSPGSEKEFAAFKTGGLPPTCQAAPTFKPMKSFGFNHFANLRKRAATLTSRGMTQVPVSLEVTTTASLKANLCRICGKTYARPSTLKTHMRTHSGEKPYRCSTCSKSFSQAANLTAHIRTHSGEKPFRCPICDRRFSQSSSVTTHVRTHSGERPYRCRLCKKAFSDSSTLTKHLRIHSGEKPYQCKLCLLRFSQSGNLNRHMRIHAAAA